jgi:drug/metabolite transporter (DMT)-like permease
MTSAPAAVLFLVMAMMLTGSNVPLAKSIVAGLPLYAFLFFRFALSVVALAVLARHEPGPRLRDMRPRQMADMAAMAAVGMLGYTVLIFEALRRTTAVDTGIIAATLPAVVAVLAALVYAERLRRDQVAAVALAVAGLLLVAGAGHGLGHAGSLSGSLLAAGAVLCEAGFVVIGKRLAPPYRPFRLSLGANVVGLLLSLPLMLWEGRLGDLAGMSLTQWIACVWYVLSASVFALWLWYRGLPGVPTWLAGVATAALPVTALAISVALLGETLAWPQVLGATFVLASIALGARAARGLSVTRPAPPVSG